MAGLRERPPLGRVLVAAGAEEPGAGAEHRPAERALEDVRVAVGPLARLERRLVGPRRVAEVVAVGARVDVAAALGDDVDDAAREAPVLRRDARGEHLRLLDGVLDEQVVARAEDVVVDVDAVDQEDVVVGERARDRHLAGVRAVVGQAGRELGDVERRAAGRQLVDQRLVEVGADGRIRDDGRGFGPHGDLLGHRGRRHRDVHFDGPPERDARRPLDRRHAVHLDGDDVLARRQPADDVDAVDVGDRRQRALERRRFDGDRRARAWTGRRST